MKKIYIGAIVAVLLTTLSISTLAYKLSNTKTIYAIDNTSVTSLTTEYDWVTYKNLKDLVTNSDLIIMGDVISDNKPSKKEMKIILPSDIDENLKQKILSDAKNTIVTESEVSVRKTLKGKSKSNIIKIEQPGGTLEGFFSKVSGVNYFKKGQKAIFFLLKAEGGDLYLTLNPFQGHIFTVDGKIKPDADNKFFIRDSSEDDVLKEIENSK
ncbi:MAG: hypothetical protein H7Y18_02150 [Clostridiaceae bacterium]|nr:hypothetical protein [Clostridiaceae bacterium]